MSSRAFPRFFGGGGRTLVLASLISFLTIVTITGCSGHSSPVDADDQGSISRMAQAFGTPTQWGVGYSLDSASTTWVYPTSSCETEANIALSDPDLDDLYTLVTAVVKHDNTEIKSEIRLILLDHTGANVWQDTFSADALSPSDPFARHPVVEVTYHHEEEKDGLLMIHIVWSEFTEGGMLDDHWDLFYRCIQYVVDGDDDPIDWDGPDEDEIVNLPFNTIYDELQPDIAVLATLNDLHVVYLQSRTFDYIMSSRHVADDMDDPTSWESPYQISATNLLDKWAPRIGAGLFRMALDQQHVIGYLAAVWCEKVWDDPYDDWQVCYNEWGAWSSPTPYSEQISTPGEGNGVSILPQIDITPQTSQFNEAIITWVMAEYIEQSETYENYNVMITATPYISTSLEFIADSDYTRCPDVACYQRTDDDMTDGEEWFGIAMHYNDDEAGDWRTEIRSYSFDVDYQTEVASFYEEEITYFGSSDAQWSFANPFTGPTLCLRNPYVDVNGSGQPVYEIFGLAWIDDGNAVELTEGTIF